MGKEKAFMHILRRTPRLCSVHERIQNHREIYKPISEEMIIEQASRCMDCGTPFCHGYGCPLGNLIPEWNDLVYKGKWEQALRLLQRTNNFPEFTARLCSALCESACTLGIGFEPVIVRYIERSIIEKGFKQGWIKPDPPLKRTGNKTAVIGSGPSGLAAADELNKMGHEVTVFEKDAKPGGLLRYGIPDFKLEKHIIDRRIDLLQQEGITFSCDVEVGIDISLKYLQKKFDASVIAIGCNIPRDLSIPGRNLKGIHFALEFLKQQNFINSGIDIASNQRIIAQGKKVVVIGGGDTGADCVGTAVRNGAKEIIQIEILPKPPSTRTPDMPWPTYPNLFNTASSHEEGGIRRWSILTKEFQGKNGNLTGLSCIEVDLEEGSFIEKPGTAFDIEADLVILATGFIHPNHTSIVDPLGIEKDGRGNIKINEKSMTSIGGFFGAGDAATGPSLVVRAIESGRKAAKEIDWYLRGVR